MQEKLVKNLPLDEWQTDVFARNLHLSNCDIIYYLGDISISNVCGRCQLHIGLVIADLFG